MKLLRLALAVLILAGVTAVAVVTRNAESSGDRMVGAAEKFLASLTENQKAKAVFAFDDKERFNWNFVPLQTKDRKSTRKGLPLEDMTAEQRKAALDLLRAGTSERGYEAATTIMSLERILNDLEKNGAMVRNPDWYFFTVFGKPSKTGSWGFRVEGHHLSLNYTLDGGSVVSATPCFYGANPATLKSGPRAGTQILAGSEKLAQELFASLDDEQKKAARQEKHFAEIEQKVTKPGVGAATGLAAAKMNEKQRDLLWKLVSDYAHRLPEGIAEVELDRAKKAGLDKIQFAFVRDDDKKGQPYTYRVQGPTFVIEFLNLQNDSAGNPGNHIHSSWRNLAGDFGVTK